jgi:hypothetical protein
MKMYGGPLPVSASMAFKKIESSFKMHGQVMAPTVERIGEEMHPHLSGVTFNYWTALDEEICLLDIKDARTSEQMRTSQWLEYISSQVFNNTHDAEKWLEKEVGKYCGVTPRKYGRSGGY